MDVNKPVRRQRRTADETRSLILTVAEDRLHRLGLAGLNIVDVAKQAGISHATLIHHFGNTQGMRTELVRWMTRNLIADFIGALDKRSDPEQLVADLFASVSSGHAKLLAWLAVEAMERDEPPESTLQLFDELIERCADEFPWRDVELARRLVMLVAATAVGWGISGDVLPRLLRLDDAAVADFPRWFARQVVAIE